MKMSKSVGSYLGEGRLSDVLALIQTLAYSPKTRRTDEGLRMELQRVPQSEATWIALACQHPEFFRVKPEKAEKRANVSLIARVVQEQEEREDGDDMHPLLSPDVANKLMELSIELHDRQLRRKERWLTVGLPLAVGVIAAAASISAAIISASSAKATQSTKQASAANLSQMWIASAGLQSSGASRPILVIELHRLTTVVHGIV
jgi:hypothetical protein